MTDQNQLPPSPPPPPSTRPERESGPPRVRIRPWPKTIMMAPTLVAALVCLVVLLIGRPNLQSELDRLAANGQAAAAAATQEGPTLGLYRNVGLVFMCILAVNLLVIFYDIRTTAGLVILAMTLALVFLFLLLNNHMAILPFLRDALYWLAPIMDIKFYLFLALVLAVLFFIAYIATRLYYWEVRPNEVIIYSGLLEKQDRLPTQGVHCEWQIDDILEYFLLGAGSLVFTFPGRPKPEILHNVLRVQRKRRELAEVLGVIRVVDDDGV